MPVDTVRGVIQITHLTKRYGSTVAVDDLTVAVHPGRVTGFLGPNGSGKSTTMRCMLQLDRADSGEVSFSGKPFRSFRAPMHEVGALLDAGYVHPGRTGANHLWWIAASNGIPRRRVDEALGLVGLAEVAGRPVKTYSLGMRQRLGLAGVLLGDPHTVILDEPANGLDPEGIRWIRDMLSHLARQGRTVFVSSHLLSEMALMADHLVVIGRGRLMEEGSVADITARYADHWVRVRSPQIERLHQALAPGAGAWSPRPDGAVEIRGYSASTIGDLAAAHGVTLHELSPQSGSLEDAFLRLTSTAQEYHGARSPGMQLPPPSGAPVA